LNVTSIFVGGREISILCVCVCILRFNGCGNDEMYEPPEMEDEDDECEDCEWASELWDGCVYDNGCNNTQTVFCFGLH